MSIYFFVDYHFFMDYPYHMPTEKPKILMVLEKNLLEKIEDFRYSNRIPTRSEAIRRLLEEALNLHEKKGNQPNSSDTLIDGLYKNIEASEKILKRQKTEDL